MVGDVDIAHIKLK